MRRLLHEIIVLLAQIDSKLDKIIQMHLPDFTEEDAKVREVAPQVAEALRHIQTPTKGTK